MDDEISNNDFVDENKNDKAQLNTIHNTAPMKLKQLNKPMYVSPKIE